MNKEDLFVDMHIHSVYSDGTCTIDEICDLAVNNNVSVISVTDHNSVIGVKSALEVAISKGLKFIPGVELDSIYNEKRCHILAYGFNPQNSEISCIAENNRKLLETADQSTLINIAQDYPIDIESYADFTFDENKGGWKLIQFLVDRGIAENFDIAVRMMKKYKEKIKFPDVKEVISAIHKAGGIAVLAHPGETFHVDNDGDDASDILIYTLIEYGIDGIECYYPRHKTTFEVRLEKICREKELYITVGSDYHGDFFKGSKHKVGCEFKRVRDLALKDLID